MEFLSFNQTLVPLIKETCPPRFSDDIVERIQIQAEQLFQLFGMRDFSRFDGWVMPDGKLWFSDFNPVSGMEQNSFLFMQAARIGFSHSDLLRYITKNACMRHNIKFPVEKKKTQKRKPVNVIFGGNTAERQVSLMSGTNVWLKLRNSKKFDPQPYLLDMKQNVWHLPYPFALNHTVEEVLDICQLAEQDEDNLLMLRRRVVEKLSVGDGELSQEWFLPQKMSLDDFFSKSEMIFLALHGGMGENGDIQKMIEDRNIPFNGPSSRASKLCMDKHQTGLSVSQMDDDGIMIPKKRRVELSHFTGFAMREFKAYWNALVAEFGTDGLKQKDMANAIHFVSYLKDRVADQIFWNF